MIEQPHVTRLLVAHFFRRFFDNDTLQADGDTLTTVVRAVSAAAIPSPMVAFFLQTHYAQAPPWQAIEDRYFFVLFSFVVMGMVSIFEWQMLFPDRLDFLVLSPLSLKPMQMFAAKAAALLGFFALFLAGCNVFGTILLPAVSRAGFFRNIYAHGAATLLAGAFAALFFLALGGVLLCVLDEARFRLASPLMQMLSVMVLILLALQFARFGGSMQALLSEPLGMARWMPPLWFLGVYEHLLHGNAAPPFAHEMTRYALLNTAAVALVALLTYPIAWTRMRRMALEGGSGKCRQPSRHLTGLLHRIIRRPGERAVFHFIGQTIARNNRYQVYLAMYCGAGLALAISCAVTFRADGRHLHPALSVAGLHAVIPLLLFWVVAGLRVAFGFPLNLAAGWIFRITGVSTNDCARAARRWVLACALGLTLFVVAALRLAGWNARHLLVQMVCGLCLCVLLTDGFFFFQKSVPFNQVRLPGRTNFPLMLTLYLGVFPPAVFLATRFEIQLEKSLPKLLLLAVAVAASHAALLALDREPAEVEEEMEGYEGEFQVLGLS